MRSLRGLWVDRILGMAAEVAFWQIVSLPPLLLALLGAVGYTGTLTGTDALVQVQHNIIAAAGQVLTPQAVAQFLAPAVSSALSHGHAGITVLGVLLSLWAGSTAMGDLMGTVTIAYAMRALRSPVRTRLLAVLFYLIEVIVGSVLLVLASIGPARLIALVHPLGVNVGPVVHALYWPVLVLICLLGVMTFYHATVPARPPWRRQFPGAALALAMAAVSVYLLRTYLTSAASIASAYAGIGAIIAVLLFVYFLALSILVGVTVNAEIDKQFPSESTRHVRRPDLEPERNAAARRRGELAEDWRQLARVAHRLTTALHKLRRSR